MVRHYMMMSVAAASLAVAGCTTVDTGLDTGSTNANSQTSPSTRAAFDAMLTRHLAAIKARNLPEIEATITSGNELELIFPSGKRTATRAEYLAFHQRWFADKGWSISFEPVSSNVGRDQGYALFKSGYTDTGEDGKTETSYAWLLFTFRLENGEWRLVHDQNTAIK